MNNWEVIGAYERVFAVDYCGTICAAKEIHSILVEGVGRAPMQRTIDSFMRECHQCSKLRHTVSWCLLSVGGKVAPTSTGHGDDGG